MATTSYHAIITDAGALTGTIDGAIEQIQAHCARRSEKATLYPADSRKWSWGPIGYVYPDGRVSLN